MNENLFFFTGGVIADAGDTIVDDDVEGGDFRDNDDKWRVGFDFSTEETPAAGDIVLLNVNFFFGVGCFLVGEDERDIPTGVVVANVGDTIVEVVVAGGDLRDMPTGVVVVDVDDDVRFFFRGFMGARVGDGGNNGNSLVNHFGSKSRLPNCNPD